MGYEVTYAGNKLHDYFNILKIKRTALPQRNNFTKNIPSIHGQVYTGYKYEPKIYTLECSVVAKDNMDYQDKMRHIAFLLDTREPSKLILGDNPHIFNYAVVDGNIDIERIKYTGRFNINFICHNPIAYSTEMSLFEGTKTANKDTIVRIENEGTSEGYPISYITFSKDAYFLQCTNYDTSTILVGVPPKAESELATHNPVIFKDTCETVTNWLPVSNILDANREINGSVIVNGGGYGLTIGSTTNGTSNKWYGVASRRNLNTNVTDFKVEVKLEHNSSGTIKGGGATPPTGNGKTYYVSADTLNVRSGRGTTYSIIGTLKKNTSVTITNIENNWGQITYNGKTGYISMDYVSLNSTPTSSGSTSSSAAYKVVPKEGLNVRSGRGTNYSKLTAIPYNTQVNISDISSGWGKVTYSGKTGYCSMAYLTKVSSSRNIETQEETSTENKMGLIEIYGFDANGNKLFKFQMADNQKYYEYTEPYVHFGNTLVLQDDEKCPAPKQTNISTDSEKTIMGDTDSGRFGKWNEMVGWFTIERRTVDNKQQWFAKVEKIGSDNRVSEVLKTQALVGNYPTGALNNIVVFFGGWNNEPIVDCMNINEVYVTDIGTPPKPQEIRPIFKQGDELEINSETQKVLKNGKSFMTELDIGSVFFKSKTGTTDIIFRSDDDNITVSTVLTPRWV